MCIWESMSFGRFEVWDAHRASTPLAAVTREAFRGPAGAAAGGALGVGGQVALPPVVHVPGLCARTVRRVLLAVRRREVHALAVDIVLAYCNTSPHYVSQKALKSKPFKIIKKHKKN